MLLLKYTFQLILKNKILLYRCMYAIVIGYAVIRVVLTKYITNANLIMKYDYTLQEYAWVWL